jgi:hypothetical protein
VRTRDDRLGGKSEVREDLLRGRLLCGRKSFLENVPENARTLSLARQWLGEPAETPSYSYQVER